MSIDILNQWIIPLVLTVIFLVFLSYRPNLMSKVKKSKKREKYLFLIDNFKISLGNWKKTILLPIILVILIDLFVMFLFSQKPVFYDAPLWFFAVTSGFTNPIAEEFLVRGVLLGLFVFLGWKLKFDGNKKHGLYLIGLLFTSYVFTISHINITLYQFTIRFAVSMLFGLLYLVNNRNLLPSIMAHGASNWFLMTMWYIV